MIKVKPNFIIIPGIISMLSALETFITERNIVWFRSLVLPDLFIPIWVLAILWEIIVIMNGSLGVILWNQFPRTQRFWVIFGLFALNLLLNVSWIYLLFQRKSFIAALIDICLLEINLIFLIIWIRMKSRQASWLLMPYGALVAYLIYANYMLWMLNG